MNNLTQLAAKLGALVLLGLPSALAQDALKVDPQLPAYRAVQGISGSIKSVGSDTMNNLMALWGDDFKKFYPNVTIEVEGKGSGTAPAALIAGTATFGPMSRPMKSAEIDEFEKVFHHKPVGLPTSIDLLAVYVHKDNPLVSLSMQQIDAIFSKTRKGGLNEDITTWGQLGLTGDWANKPISMYGRNSASGTYGFFKEHALFKGDFKDTVKEQPGSSAVVQGVATDKYGIGYSGLGYKTADVRAVAVAADAQTPAVEASAENAYSGEYPLSRFLYMYLNNKPGTELDPLRREFIRYVYSAQGQQDVIKDGFFPLTPELAQGAMSSVGLRLELVEAGMKK